MLATSVTPVESLYIHVPFCARKCDYCAFYSEPSSANLIHRYVAALIREMDSVAGMVRPRTIYFGGGTPSLLNLSQWGRILDAMARLDWLGAAEWTIECNPATVTLDKARLWRDHGANRISLGVQSLDAALLNHLGRVHSRTAVFNTFALLRRAGFANIGLDLMFAIPGQTLEVWRATLDEALALEPEHLSCYEVTYEEDTPLYAQLQANQLSVDEDLACAMYDGLLDRADARGFVQYEVSNFARCAAGLGPLELPAFVCQHNLNYWAGGSFVGLGPSAASFVHGVRTQNWPNTRLYCERLERGERPIEASDALPPLRRAGEIAAFGLRRNTGWRFEEFLRVTGFDLRTEWQSELQQLVEQDWGILTPDGIRLTRAGLRFADAVAERFLR
jgi:oxygen-independent coproporphyrinogen-3 oxidase